MKAKVEILRHTWGTDSQREDFQERVCRRVDEVAKVTVAPLKITWLTDDRQIIAVLEWTE